MRKEDRAELIHDALNQLDDDLIEDVDRLRGNELKKTKMTSWHKWTALAASICILVAGSLMMGDFLENIEPDRDSVESNQAESENQNDNDNLEDERNPANMNDASVEDESEVLDLFEYETEIEAEVSDQSKEEIEYDDKEVGKVETENAPPEVEEPNEEEIQGGILDDLYQLKDNYIRVSMIPHKVWESAEDEDTAYQQAVSIKEKYQDDFAKFVNALCDGKYVQVEESLQGTPNSEDMIYHLFFEKKDGEVVHLWLLGDNRAFYHEEDTLCIIVEDEDLYNSIYKILAMHW